MKVPQLKKKLEIKSCHNINWEDNYSWIHQDNILEVLKDTKELQKKLFNEIKGRIKLDDESLPFKDKEYEYWQSRFCWNF